MDRTNRTNPADPSGSAEFGDGCGDVKVQLGARLDGELSPEAAAEIERHLDGCSACRRVEWELREDWNLLGSLTPRSHGETEPFLRALRERVIRRRRVALRSTWLAAAACLIAAVTVIAMRAGRVDPELMNNLPVLVDIQNETEGLDSELIGLLLDELDSGTARGAVSRDEPARSAKEADAGVFDFVLEEELLAGATRL